MKVRVAVPVAVPSVAVTVSDPAAVAVQVAAVQDPSGPIVNIDAPVMSPRSLLYWSNPSAMYACVPPALMVADAGEVDWLSPGQFVEAESAVQ